MAITKEKIYEPLNEQTAIELVKTLNFFAPGAELVVHEIGDGNLNLVFQIKDLHTSKSLIIKQALPYARVVGESWPLTLDRSRIESDALKLAGEVVPNLVPEVYYTNPTLALTVMEDLSTHTILRKGLIARNKYPQLADHIGTYLAKTLFFTSDFALHPFKKKELTVNFTNPELCKITEDLVFTDPFHDHDTNDFPFELIEDVKQIWGNTKLKLEVAKLKKKFLTEQEALLHGDLHTGSIFATEQSTKVIDPEFAYYGPIGFDVGAFLANIFLNAVALPGHTTDKKEIVEYREHLLQIARDTWTVFSATFSQLWKENGLEIYTKVDGYLEVILQDIFRDSIGFAGCKIIRRIIGLAHVEDIESILDDTLKMVVKRKALKIGQELILQQTNIQNIDDLITLVEAQVQ
jgi:5-methylthioribose kinase